MVRFVAAEDFNDMRRIRCTMGDGYSAQGGGAGLARERWFELPWHLRQTAPVLIWLCAHSGMRGPAAGGMERHGRIERRCKQVEQLQRCAVAVLVADAGASSLHRSAP